MSTSTLPTTFLHILNSKRMSKQVSFSIIGLLAIAGAILITWSLSSNRVLECEDFPYVIKVEKMNLPQAQTTDKALRTDTDSGRVLFFRITISPPESQTTIHQGDLVNEALLLGPNHYRKNLFDMSFRLEDYIGLRLNGGEVLRPSICELIRDFGCNGGTNVIVAGFRRSAETRPTRAVAIVIRNLSIHDLNADISLPRGWKL